MNDDLDTRTYPPFRGGQGRKPTEIVDGALAMTLLGGAVVLTAIVALVWWFFFS